MFYFTVQNQFYDFLQVIQQNIDRPVILLPENCPCIAIYHFSLFLNPVQVKTVIVCAFSSS
jgi:hypothetical protein